MRVALFLSVLAVACTGAINPRDRVVSDFTPEYPKNYLIVHEGKSADFAQAKCYVLRAEDEDARINVGLYIGHLIEQRLPMLRPCAASDWPRLEMTYEAGYGVCIDCGGTKSDPRSAFSGIALASGPNYYVASAEWQYWRGGTAELVAQQYVFDLTNLYVNGLEKPIPRGRPNSM